MKMRSLLIAGIAVLVSSTAMAADSIKANASAGEGTMAATLAPYGSFEFIAAPSYTKNALARRNAAVALRAKKITVAQAEGILRKTDEVRSLLDRSLRACKQDNKSGACKGDQRQAYVLLTEANAKLAAL